MHLSAYFKTIIITCLLVVEIAALEDENEVVVKVEQGKIAGIWGKSLNERPMATFFGVPYALPPIDERRFEKPEPIKSWDGVWQAKNIPNSCIQWYYKHKDVEGSIVGSEDCLYLNIYTPNPSKDVSLPVIVYIHGGAYIFGSGGEYEGDFILDKDVVFININYRLGALGFMSTQDEVVPGNVGLHDQVAALKFIKQNVKYFGGNPDDVTIMGMSAGGASVNFHMISSVSEGLFSKAYSQSGTTLTPWTLQEKPLMKAKMLGNALGCPTNNNRKMVDCLKQRPARDILRTTPLYIPFVHTPFSPFAPVVEKKKTKTSFISENPYEIIKKGKVRNVPWLTSVTKHEGLYPAAIFLNEPEFLPEIESRWNELAPLLFDFNLTLPQKQLDEVSQKIKKEYLGGKPVDEKTFDDFVGALGDRHFVVSSEACARLYAKVSSKPVYFYRFNYRGEGSLALHLSGRDKCDGVSHGDDTGYAIKGVYMDPTTTKNDLEMVESMVDLLVTFASTGKPTFRNVEWTPMDGNSEKFNVLEIYGPKKAEMKSVKDLSRTKFWASLKLHENDKISPDFKDEL